jgi:hypothetical protein
VTALRLLLNLTLVVAVAVICPIRCHAAGGGVADQASVEPSGCSCCHQESSELPVAPVGDDCCGGDCICDGAVDGPRVAAIDLPSLAPNDAPLADLRAAVASNDSVAAALDAPPDAPDGATMRVLLASWLI